jgi:hypothetical protein
VSHKWCSTSNKKMRSYYFYIAYLFNIFFSIDQKQQQKQGLYAASISLYHHHQHHHHHKNEHQIDQNKSYWLKSCKPCEAVLAECKHCAGRVDCISCVQRFYFNLCYFCMIDLNKKHSQIDRMCDATSRLNNIECLIRCRMKQVKEEEEEGYSYGFCHQEELKCVCAKNDYLPTHGQLCDSSSKYMKCYSNLICDVSSSLCK